MALLTDINDLLKKRKVESDRIEFKKGWNPTAIYRSICAFANDIEDIGGDFGHQRNRRGAFLLPHQFALPCRYGGEYGHRQNPPL